MAADPDGELHFVEAPPLREAARSPSRDAERPVDGARRSRTRHLRAELSADGSLLGLVERASGREALARTGQPARAVRGPPASPGTPGTSIRRTSRRGRTARPRARGGRHRRRRCAPRSRSSGASASRAACGRSSGSTPARGALEFHRGRLARVAPAPQGLLPARGARAEGDLRDAVRLSPSGRRTARRAGTPRSYEVPGHRFADLSRARLRRRRCSADSKYGYSCHGGELRVSLLRGAEVTRSRRRHRAARVRLRAPSPRRRLAGGRRAAPRRSASTPRCAGAPAPRRSRRSPRSTTRTSSSTRSSARRTRTRSCSASTRPTARAARRGSRSRRRSQRRGGRTCSRIPARRSRSRGPAIVVPYRPHEIVTMRQLPVVVVAPGPVDPGGQVELAASYMSLFCPGRHVFVPPFESDPSPEPPTTAPPVRLRSRRSTLPASPSRTTHGSGCSAPDPRPCTSRSSCRA